MVNSGQNCPNNTSRKESLFRRTVLERYCKKARVVLILQGLTLFKSQHRYKLNGANDKPPALFSRTLTLHWRNQVIKLALLIRWGRSLGK